MKLRYRILSAREDPQAYVEDARARQQATAKAQETFREHHPVIFHLTRRGSHGSWEDSSPNVVDDLVGMPQAVDVAEEGEALPQELLLMVRAGQLKPLDLVDDGTGWRCAKDSPALFEHFAAAEENAQSATTWVVAALLGGATAVLALVLLS